MHHGKYLGGKINEREIVQIATVFALVDVTALPNFAFDTHATGVRSGRDPTVSTIEGSRMFWRFHRQDGWRPGERMEGEHRWGVMVGSF